MTIKDTNIPVSLDNIFYSSLPFSPPPPPPARTLSLSLSLSLFFLYLYLSMGLLQVDSDRYHNTFMHMSLSKVLYWHSIHASKLWSRHDRCQSAIKKNRTMPWRIYKMPAQKKLIRLKPRKCMCSCGVHNEYWRTIVQRLSKKIVHYLRKAWNF